jgi:hypothetical protein
LLTVPARARRYERAIAITENGLAENPRYGPLWFTALRLYERLGLGPADDPRHAHLTVERALRHVSQVCQ